MSGLAAEGGGSTNAVAATDTHNEARASSTSRRMSPRRDEADIGSSFASFAWLSRELDDDDSEFLVVPFDRIL
jgi:hypothetical protein